MSDSDVHDEPPETPELSEEAAAEAVKGGPGYPPEVEEAWEEARPMEGEAPTG